MSRFLIVEDNEASLELMRDLLEYKGHEVVCATDVEEALSRLRETIPDVVLTDFRLPGVGGDVLLQTIRAAPAFHHIPVIVMTALAMNGDRERMLAMGFHDYISKPINVRAFGKLIDALTR